MARYRSITLSDGSGNRGYGELRCHCSTGNCSHLRTDCCLRRKKRTLSQSQSYLIALSQSYLIATVCTCTDSEYYDSRLGLECYRALKKKGRLSKTKWKTLQALEGLMEELNLNGFQGAHPSVARLGAKLEVWYTLGLQATDFPLGRNGDFSFVLRVAAVSDAASKDDYLPDRIIAATIGEPLGRFRLQAALGLPTGSWCELVIIDTWTWVGNTLESGQRRPQHGQEISIGKTRLQDGSEGELVIRITESVEPTPKKVRASEAVVTSEITDKVKGLDVANREAVKETLSTRFDDSKVHTSAMALSPPLFVVSSIQSVPYLCLA